MDRDIAKQLIERFEAINKSIFSTVDEFQDTLSDEEFSQLTRGVAKMGVMADSHIYPLVLKQYPELNPLLHFKR